MKSLCVALAFVLAMQQDTPASLAEALRALAARVAALAKAEQPSTSEPATLQAVIDAAQPGTTIYLRPGAIYGATRVTRSVRLTTQGSQPSTARVTPADAAGFAIVEPTGNLPAFDISASNVTIDNIAIRGNVDTHINCGSTSATSVEQQPSNVTLSRLYLDGSAGAKRAIGLHCVNARVEQSYCVGYRRVGQDTQCIGGWNGPGPYVIRDNYLQAAGENVMFGGAAPAIAGMVPRNIQILDNHFSKDTAWKAANYTVKNHLEFKIGEHVIVRGNRFETMWAAGQAYSVMLTPQAQDAANPNCIVADVLIERNEFINVSGGIVIKGRQQLGTPCLQGSGFVIRQNWLQITRTFNGGAAQGWPFFLSGEPRGVTIEQNTIDADGNHFVYQEGPPILAFRFVGNLITRGWAYGMAGNVNGTVQQFAIGLATWAPGSVVSGNAIVGFKRPSNLPNNLHIACLAWSADGVFCTTPPTGIVQNGYGVGEYAIYGRTR